MNKIAIIVGYCAREECGCIEPICNICNVCHVAYTSATCAVQNAPCNMRRAPHTKRDCDRRPVNRRSMWTSICLPRLLLACVSVWDQRAVQHAHRAARAHVPIALPRSSALDLRSACPFNVQTGCCDRRSEIYLPAKHPVFPTQFDSVAAWMPLVGVPPPPFPLARPPLAVPPALPSVSDRPVRFGTGVDARAHRCCEPSVPSSTLGSARALSVSSSDAHA